MSVEMLDGGAERFVTQGGIVITRERHEVPYQGAIEGYIDALDSRRGCVFSSNYEFPGRYTRWDTAMIDPPLVVTAKGRAMRIEALNARGEVLLPVILDAIGGLADVAVRKSEARLITLQVAKPATMGKTNATFSTPGSAPKGLF
jgi:anthranilate synthase